MTLTTDLNTCSNLTGYILTGYISKTSGTSWPNGVNLSTLTNVITADSKCKFGAATNQNTGDTLSNFYFYVCVLPVATAGSTWGGIVRLSGIPTGSTVCRYQYSDTNFINDNERNVQPYSNVNQSLDNQNYVVYQHNSRACPLPDDTGGLQTVLHQDCRTSNAARATDCPATALPTPS